MPREREAHCLAVTMMDVWQTEQEVAGAEQAWRHAQQTHSEQSSAARDTSSLFVRLATREASVVMEQAAVGGHQLFSPRGQEYTVLYRRITDARARHNDASKWYGLVARRVQTRIEEDEMLYPVLGMLATSTAIVVYPLVRWNVRSVLWDGMDPDSEQDLVQQYCAGRLGEAPPTPLRLRISPG